MIKGCNICGHEVKVEDGGCALMMAFCRRHTTNLINLAFCKSCYEMFLEEPLHLLNKNAMLNIVFGDEDGGDGE